MKTVLLAKQTMDRIFLAVENANDGLWYRNYLTGEAWYSARWKRMLGYEDHELPNAPEVFRSLVFSDDWSSIQSACTAHLAGETPIYDCLFRMKHHSGTWRWIHSRGKARFGSDGRAEEFAGSHTDVTEYKVQTDFHKELLEMLPVLVSLKDQKRRFHYVNKAVEEYFNRSRDTVLGKTQEELALDDEQAKQFRADDEKILKGELAEIHVAQEPLTNQSSGEVRHLQTRKRLLSFPSNNPQPHVLAVATDITDTLAAQEQLRIMRDSLKVKLQSLTDLVVDIEKSTSERDACNTAILRLQEFGDVFGYPSVMISFKRIIDGRPCIIAEPDYATGVWKNIAPHMMRLCDVSQTEMDITALVLENGRAEFVSDSRNHVAFDQNLARKVQLVSQYVIPLQTASSKLGILQIAMGERERPPEDRSYYDAIAAHLSVAIERHRSLAELERINKELTNQARILAFDAAAAKIMHELMHAIGDYADRLRAAVVNPEIRCNKNAEQFLQYTQQKVGEWIRSVSQNVGALKTNEEVGAYEVEKIIKETVETWYRKAQLRNCTIQMECNAPGKKAHVRFGALKEAVSCLIVNAIEANAKDIRVIVRAVPRPPDVSRASERIDIEVLDNGDGIPLEFRDKLKTFGWTSKVAIGHGIGLTIVDLLSKRMGGSFDIVSYGKASGEPLTRFVLRLPSVLG